MEPGPKSLGTYDALASALINSSIYDEHSDAVANMLLDDERLDVDVFVDYITEAIQCQANNA